MYSIERGIGMDLRKLDVRSGATLLEGDTLTLKIDWGEWAPRTITGVPVGLFNGHVVLQEDLGEGAGAIENRYAYHILPSTITAPSFKAAREMRAEDAQPGDVIQCAMAFESCSIPSSYATINLCVVLHRPQGESGRLFVRCQRCQSAETWEDDPKAPHSGWYSERSVGLIHRPALVREVSLPRLIQDAAADVPPGWKPGDWLAHLVKHSGEGKDGLDAVSFQESLPTLREAAPPIVKGWWNS